MTFPTLALSIVALLFWGLGQYFDKLALAHLSPKAVFYARLYLLFILLLMPMVVYWEETRLAVWKADRRAIAYLLGTVICTYAGMYAYYYALNRSGASRVVPFCASYPLITFVLAVTFLKEPFAWPHLAGTAFIVVGAVMLGWQ